MRVYLVTAYPDPPGAPDNHPCRWLRESARLDPFREHELVDHPDSADLVLFAEEHPDDDLYVLRVRHHPCFRRHRRKCVLYHDADYAVPILRGIYPSILRRDYLPERCRSGPYIARLSPNEAIQYDPAPVEKRWLYSFYGANNSPVRRAFFASAQPGGNVRDTTGLSLWTITGAEREAYIREYVETLRSSKFVLCPAGLGPSTYRLYETMELAGVPVILSDQWVPPAGPDWDQFSLRVPEARIRDLDAILVRHEDHHAEMGRRARAAWEQWFSPAVAFHRLVETAREVLALKPSLVSSLHAWSTLTRPPHFVNWARFAYRSLRTRRGN